MLNGLPWKWTEIILLFLRLHPSTAFQSMLLTFVDYDGYSISSKGFLPTIVDIMVIWVKFTHSSPFYFTDPKMSTFTLAISCLTTSNLPWYMDPTFQVPMQYFSLQHWTLLPSPVISTTGCCFCFGSVTSFFLELFVYSSLVAYWAPTDLGSSSFSVLSFCLFYCSWVLKARILKWFAIPFSSGPHFVITLHYDPSILGGPTQHGS